MRDASNLSDDLSLALPDIFSFSPLWNVNMLTDTTSQYTTTIDHGDLWPSMYDRLSNPSLGVCSSLGLCWLGMRSKDVGKGKANDDAGEREVDV